jgi:hypothetical protein
MRHLVVPFLFASLALGACTSAATPEGAGGNAQQTGAGGNTQQTGAGGNTANNGCTSDPTQLVNAAGWNCDLSTPIQIQGSIYSYGDGTACPASSTKAPCSAAGCCIMGTTTPATAANNYATWGCGLGMELDSSGGTSPVKSVYAGPVKCFNITLTGSSGGNVVRIGFTQSPAPASGAIAPYKEIGAFTNGWTGQVCFSDVDCPSYATAAQCSKAVGGPGTPVDMQIQVSAGDSATNTGTFNVCMTSVEPVLDSSNTGTTMSCSTTTGSGTITDPFGTAHVTCNSKDYIVQSNAWGSNGPQTLTYGPGTKFKVTAQGATGQGSNPTGFPSIFIGANSNHTTASSGLPRAISQIAPGSLMTSWTWATNGATGSYNAAYDVWFSTSASGDPSASSPSGGFLMVWFHKPSANQPIGTLVASATVGGKGFNIWYGTNSGNNKPCVSYVAQTDIMSWTYSLGDFINDAIGRSCQGSTKCLNSSLYLSNVFAGYEIWSGGIGLETTDFAVNVP